MVEEQKPEEPKEAEPKEAVEGEEVAAGEGGEEAEAEERKFIILSITTRKGDWQYDGWKMIWGLFTKVPIELEDIDDVILLLFRESNLNSSPFFLFNEEKSNQIRVT